MTAAPRRGRAVILVGIVALLAAAVWVSKVTEGSLRKVPGTIRLTGPAKTFTLDDVRSDRAVVSLQAISERYRGRIAFVGVTFNDGREAAKGALERAGVTYPAAFDPKSDLAYDYGVRVMPTTVFIGPDGNLVQRKDGEFSEVQLRTVIDRLFGSATAVASR